MTKDEELEFYKQTYQSMQDTIHQQNKEIKSLSEKNTVKNIVLFFLGLLAFVVFYAYFIG